jgi:flagellar hook-length control protein FliK
MSITPVSTPSVPPAPRALAGDGSAAAADFAALVQGRLSGHASDGTSGGSSGSLAAKEAAAVLEATSAANVIPSDGLAVLLAGLVARPADVVALTGVAGGSHASGTSDAGTAPGAAGSGLSAAAVPGGLALGAVTEAGGLLTPVGNVLDGSATFGEAATGMTPGTVSAGGSAAGMAGAAANDAVAPAPGGAKTSAPAGNDSSAMAVAAAAAAVGAPGPGGVGAVTSTEPAAVSTGDRGSLVTGQVFPEVTRLVGRGDGSHRMTLRLHPADLGEVKVILTVKDNTVDVTLSAGPAAREALREGSPQLRALLELAGATTGQLVVRDLTPVSGATTGLPSGPSTAIPDTDLAGGDPRGEQDFRDGDHGTGRDPDGGRTATGPAPTPAVPSGRPAGLTHLDSRLDLDL